jgi:hypothetical protein
LKTIDKLDSVEIYNFYAASNTIRKEKDQPLEWEKIFSGCASEKICI